MRILFVVLLGACAADGERASLPADAHPVTHADVFLDDGTVDRVDTAVLAFAERYGLPAVGLALVADGEVVLSAAYGWADLASARVATPDVPFLQASVSKTFIGIAAMQAQEAGLLDIDDPISDIVGFPVDNPFVRDETITYTDVLTHHAGISDSVVYDDSYVSGDPAVALGAFVEGYVTEGGRFWDEDNFNDVKPGREFEYSNVGAALAGYAVEAAAGQPYHEVVRQWTLEPLGMANSAFFLADLSSEPAVGYGYALGRGSWRSYTDYGFPSYPDGLMRSSPADMGRYVAAVQDSGKSILSAAATDEMLAVFEGLGTDEDGQAVVWSRRNMGGRTLYGHNGSDSGASAELWIDRDANVGISIMVNADLSWGGWDALLELENELLDIVDSSRPAAGG